MSADICEARGATVAFRCERVSEPPSRYCFWHSDREKRKDEIEKQRIEVRAKGEFVEGALVFGRDLRGTNFAGLKLVEAKFGAGKPTVLSKADFSRSDLWRAQFRGSDIPLDLSYAKFYGSNLLETLFDSVNLDGANFGNAVLRSTAFKYTSMRNVLLGDARRLDDLEFDNITWESNKANVYERSKEWAKAQRVYQAVKQTYTRQGDLETAGEFFYREMECRRKGAEGFLARVGYAFLFLFWGYGEKPFRAICGAIVSILLFAVLYSILDFKTAFLYHLYFSAVSFTALGYDWMPAPPEAIRALGVLEALFGVVVNGAFLVTLTRKMTR